MPPHLYLPLPSLSKLRPNQSRVPRISPELTGRGSLQWPSAGVSTGTPPCRPALSLPASYSPTPGNRVGPHPVTPARQDPRSRCPGWSGGTRARAPDMYDPA
uniref:Uncharacterized protein n=1 Tax=Knipowitschia caucasica TaxID=637954 RepID=A0AAV2JUJ5_KNICA